MWLCDNNVWLALALSGHIHHAHAREWLESVEQPNSILFCRATQQAFLRLLTNKAVMTPYGNPPLTNQEAWYAYESLLTDGRILFRAQEPAGVDHHWRKFALRDTASPKLWMDAYLAAFALAGRYRMVTTDAAFSQFGGLDLVLLARPS